MIVRCLNTARSTNTETSTLCPIDITKTTTVCTARNRMNWDNHCMTRKVVNWITIRSLPVFTTKRKRTSFSRKGRRSRKNMGKITTKCILLHGNTRKWRYWIQLNLYLKSWRWWTKGEKWLRDLTSWSMNWTRNTGKEGWWNRMSKRPRHLGSTIRTSMWKSITRDTIWSIIRRWRRRHSRVKECGTKSNDQAVFHIYDWRLTRF